MKKLIEINSKFNVGDKVFGIYDGKVVYGTVEEICVSVDPCRIASVYSVPDDLEVLIQYKIKVSLGGFCETPVLPERSLASSLEEFYVFGK